MQQELALPRIIAPEVEVLEPVQIMAPEVI